MAKAVSLQNARKIHQNVREHYAGIVDATTSSSKGCGCSGDSASCCPEASTLYGEKDWQNLPGSVTEISLGCGDPVTLASLVPGLTVLDLGSGGGIDCFLAAQRVGPTGRVIGVDMTAKMIERARANQEKIGLNNVEFRLGEIEHLPVADASVDVVISNCVINLSPDKPQVFSEIHRVLRSGGRVAVSDIVTDGELPDEIKQDLAAWAGCVAGAWQAEDYVQAIRAAGFVDITLTPGYFNEEQVAEATSSLKNVDTGKLSGDELRKTIFSAKITARKP